MLSSAFGKKGRIEDQMITQESNQKNVYVYVQASLLAAAARTAEVSTLKQDLKRSEDELGLTKRQLEESKGKQYLVYAFKKKFGCK